MRHQARLVDIVSPPGDAHTMFDESAMPLLATPPLHRQNQIGTSSFLLTAFGVALCAIRHALNSFCHGPLSFPHTSISR